MIGHAIFIGLASIVGTTAPDTTFAVPPGGTVVIVTAHGDVEIRPSEGREASVLADGESRGISIQRTGEVTRVMPTFARMGNDADLEIRLPVDVSVDIQGGSGDIRVIGLRAAVTIQTLDGDIEIEGATAVSVHSVDGDVTVTDATGPIAINAGDGDISLTRVGGPLAVNGIDGDVTVRGGDASEVSLATVSGDLWYDGRIYAGGEYVLGTHDGDVTFAMGEDVGARVSILTYDGSLSSSFPLQLRGSVGNIAEFTLGSGSARVQLESFDGDIHLIRPGERSP